MKKRTMVRLICMLCAAMMLFTACGGGPKSYTATQEFTDDNPAGEDIMTGTSMAKVETTLEVDGESYTLTKTSYGRAQEDTTYIVEDKWYTNYTMAYQYVFKGTCTTDGDKVTLSVPTEATKLCYYQFDVHAQYPNRFPIAMTDGEVTLSSTDEDMKYFNGLYIMSVDASGDAAKEQTATVGEDGKLISIE